MAEYFQIEFRNISSSLSEQLIAELSELKFEGFEEEENILKAFIPLRDFDEIELNKISIQFKIPFTKSLIEETNWNQLWESNFQPVIIDDFVAIRAAFHKPIKNVKHEIVITPKMSFGTGHHATTYMMIKQMKEIDFSDKIILDFGTGTGILSILAEKMGARKIVAIDNDEWSMENAVENFQQNNCKIIELKKADNASTGNKFGIILANINKNVIMENFSFLATQLLNNGVLLLSGILIKDEKDILDKAKENNLQKKQKSEENNWLCISLCH